LPLNNQVLPAAGPYLEQGLISDCATRNNPGRHPLHVRPPALLPSPKRFYKHLPAAADHHLGLDGKQPTGLCADPIPFGATVVIQLQFIFHQQKQQRKSMRYLVAPCCNRGNARHRQQSGVGHPSLFLQQGCFITHFNGPQAKSRLLFRMGFCNCQQHKSFLAHRFVC